MAIISWATQGDPEFGMRHGNGKWRVLVGWNHADDTPEGRKKGKIWGWTSESPEKFQVFDEDFNRSKTPGSIRDCGVANFTMIRMFHPFWALNGVPPKDMVHKDKRECRRKYHEIIRKHRLSLDLPVDETREEYEARMAAEKKARKDAKEAATAARKETAHQRKELTETRKAKKSLLQRQIEDALPGTLEVVPGGSADDAMSLSGAENSDHDNREYRRLERSVSDHNDNDLMNSDYENTDRQSDVVEIKTEPVETVMPLGTKSNPVNLDD